MPGYRFLAFLQHLMGELLTISGQGCNLIKTLVLRDDSAEMFRSELRTASQEPLVAEGK